jgi:hypothetical protein
MDALYIQTEGDRQDLADIEVNAPEGYIGNKILPVTVVAEKAGSLAYSTVTADEAAQTSRTAGTAPTSKQISNTATTLSCLQYEKRGSITPDEAKQMGGIAKAEVVGAKYAKRQVMNAYETAVRNEILGLTVEATFDAAKILTQIQTADADVRLYQGKTSLVASTMTIKKMVVAMLGNSVTGPVFARLISGTNNATAAAGLSFNAWVNGLATYLGVDQVLAGDDAIWNASTYAGRFAIARLDDGTDELSHKWNPVFGKTFQFLPDGSKNPWQITAVADRVNKNNHLDAELWFDTIVLNSGAAYLFDGVV